MIIILLLLAPLALRFVGERIQPILEFTARWVWILAILGLTVLTVNMNAPNGLFERILEIRMIVALYMWVGLAMFAVYYRNPDAIAQWHTLANQRPTLMRGAILMIAALPVVLVFYVIARYGVNVPFGDEWRRVVYYANDELLKFNLGQFWVAKKGVHRNFLPEVIATGSYYFTRANQFSIFYLNWAINIAIAGLISLIYDRLAGKPRWYVVLPAITLMLFALSVKQYWLLTVLLHVHVMWLCVIGGMALILLSPRGPVPVALAAVLAFVASTSVLEGNLSWLAFGVCLWAAGYRRWTTYTIWVTLMLTQYGIHLQELIFGPGGAYIGTTEAPPLTGIVAYILAYLGQSPLASTPPLFGIAGLTGVIGLVVLIGLSIHALRSDGRAVPGGSPVDRTGSVCGGDSSPDRHRARRSQPRRGWHRTALL